MKKKRILFDTNIIIKREDPSILPADFIELNKTINDLNYKIFVHPLSINDINRDKNQQRKEISLSKLGTYSQIEKAPTYESDTNFKNIVGSENKENDLVDNSLLYAVYKNAADILVTEDKGILSKAQLLNLGDRVFNISDAILCLSKDVSLQDVSLLSCFKKDKGWNINLSDSIFDTLKNEYPNFEKWWQEKVCRTSRDIFIYASESENDKNKIKALLILKEEDNEILNSEPQIILYDVLKICLFKVDESTRGMKLGERLLKMAFEEAISKNKTKLYLTHYTITSEDKLVSLIETYGFHFLTKTQNGESVYYKEIRPTSTISVDSREKAIDVNKQFFPSFYDGNIVSKYIIPIQPHFFKRLFPDVSLEDPSAVQLSLELNIKKLDQYSSEGFSIQKAYICNTPVHTMQEGDILCFYRTEDYKSILTLGTIEKVYYNINNADEIYRLIKKRTVYKKNEIEEMCLQKTQPVVILFKHNLNFINDVKYSFLHREKIVKGTIQTVRKIHNDDLYRKIIQGNINESLIINKA